MGGEVVEKWVEEGGGVHLNSSLESFIFWCKNQLYRELHSGDMGLRM